MVRACISSQDLLGVIEVGDGCAGKRRRVVTLQYRHKETYVKPGCSAYLLAQPQLASFPHHLGIDIVAHTGQLFNREYPVGGLRL